MSECAAVRKSRWTAEGIPPTLPFADAELLSDGRHHSVPAETRY